MRTICCNSDEISLIQEEIIQLDKVMSQLQGKRGVLLQRLNSAQAETRNLPPETLSLIFEQYIASWPIHLKDTDYIGLLTIGHVSSYWRQVLWSTPHLWTSLRVKLFKQNPHHISRILELHLQNVGNLPFNFDLDLPTTSSDPGAPIKDILTKYSTKVHGLGLSYPPIEWFDTLREFSSLERISISGNSEGQLVLTELPQLQHVTLCINADIQLPWTTVTTLILESFPPYKCATLLMQCPNLVHFSAEGPCASAVYRSTDPTITPGSIFKFPPTPIILSKLQYFQWSYYSSPWDRPLFQTVRLPALSELSLDYCSEEAQEDVKGDILTLFHNLEDTLQVLTIISLERWTIPFAKNIFSRSHSLRKMTLVFLNAASLYSVLRALCPGSDGDNATYLPLLNDLTIEYLQDEAEEETLKPEISSQVLDLCRARSTTPNFKLTFTLDEVKLTWAPGVWEELSAMVLDGFDLNIKHCHQAVRWLS